MSGLEVSSVIASILSAFNSGLDVFRRTRPKSRSKRKDKSDSFQNPCEVHLQNSLQQRPKDIQIEYNRSVAKLGYRFEIGDSVAQTSLAHTLLVLNTGLLNILNKALSRKSKAHDDTDRHLLSLSQTAAADALQALSQLDLRLSSTSSLMSSPMLSSPQLALEAAPVPKPTVDHTSKRRVAEKAAKKVVDSKRKKPPPDNLLVRGGWVKPKADSSTASSASASKVNLVKPSHQRSKSSPVIPKIPAVGTRRQSQPETTSLMLNPMNGSPDQVGRPTHRRTLSSPRPHREPSMPSMALMSSDFFQPTPNTNFASPQFDQQLPVAPPIPPKIPLHSRPTNTHLTHNLAGMRVRPPSVATFMTASTKIGEIPDHRLPPHERRNQPRQSNGGLVQQMNPPPQYALPPALNPVEVEKLQKQSKGRDWGFRLWKRREDKVDKPKNAGVLAY